ncbi:hypothetical protein FXO37_11210 [Capsicum annuum]|nr:hypothetical protein FXO37_11210 [Capsicum annuum]
MNRLGIQANDKEAGRAESSLIELVLWRFSMTTDPKPIITLFFDMNETAFDQRVKIAAIHFEGEAIAWHRSYMKARNSLRDPSWIEYVIALNERFGEEFEGPMEALKNLTQTGGLKPELNKTVRIQAPKTLMQAYKITRLQDEVFETQAKSWGLRSIVKPISAPILPTPNQAKPSLYQKALIPANTYKKPVETQANKTNRFSSNGNGRRLTAAEMDEKRAKGLCFFCDEKYVLGHKCNTNRHIYMVDILEDEMLIEEDKKVNDQDDKVELDEIMTISLQAFTGVTGYQTIRVTGYHVKRPLQVLIDTGSTHNFIDQDVVQKLG